MLDNIMNRNISIYYMASSSGRATISRNPMTITKKFHSVASFNEEVNGINLTKHLTAVPTSRIDHKNLSIHYERGVPLLDIITPELFWDCFIAAAIAIDDFHINGLAHGDVWLGNMVVRTHGPLAGHVLLIDLETVTPAPASGKVNSEKMGKDIIDFLDDLEIRVPEAKDIISIIKSRCLTKETVFRKGKPMTYTRVRDEVIGRFRGVLDRGVKDPP